MINHLNTQQSKQQRDWFQTLIAQSDNNLLGQNLPIFNHLRSQARQDIARLPLVQRKQESWRYSHSEKLFKQQFYPLKNNSSAFYKPSLEIETALSSDNFKLVFVNGQFNTDLSSPLPGNNELAEGIIVGNLHDVLQTHPKLVMQYFEESAQHGEQLFTALNTALMNYGVFIYLDENVCMQQSIELVYISSPVVNAPGSETNSNMQDNLNIANLRNIIVLQAGASLNLTEHFSGDKNAQYFNNNLVDIIVNQAASIKHSVLQNESCTAFHLNSVFLSLYQDCIYQGQHISLGSSWSRTDYNVNFKETGATCDLKGLYTVADKQLNDIHLDINHAVPGCTSREQFKGILYGEGRAVFDGHVIVDMQAQHSDASMKNDNLVISENAEVDTKPQLEIYANDVKCSHGTTVGQLDEQQLFYLRSRGIEKNQAVNILCLGFASEIMDSIDEPLFQNLVKSVFAKRLKDVVSISVTEKTS